MLISDLYILTIFLVHALNLPDVHAALDDIVIELVEKGRSSEFWTGEAGQRVEVQMVHSPQDQQSQRQRQYRHA